MDNLKLFEKKTEYDSAKGTFKAPVVSYVVDEDKVYYLPIEMLVDQAGLREIGWSDEDINYFNDVVITNDLWTMEEKPNHLVPQADKDLKPMNKSKIAGVKTTMKYCPYFDTSQETDMYYMFKGCTSLTTVPQLNTSKVTDMFGMFYGCTSLTTVPKFDTSNVTDMHYMFFECEKLISVPKFDTSKVTNMNHMFHECGKLISVPKFDTRLVTDMSYFYYDCSGLTSIPQLDTSKVTNMKSMFDSCSGLTSVPKLNISNAIDMQQAFSMCPRLTSIELSGGMNKNCDCSNAFYLTTTTGKLKIHVGNGITRESYRPIISVLPSTWTVEEIKDNIA